MVSIRNLNRFIPWFPLKALPLWEAAAKQSPYYSVLEKGDPCLRWRSFVAFAVVGHLMSFQRVLLPSINGHTTGLTVLFALTVLVLVYFEWNAARVRVASFADSGSMEQQILLTPLALPEILGPILQVTNDRILLYAYVLRSCGFWGMLVTGKLSPSMISFMAWFLITFYSILFCIFSTASMIVAEAIYWKLRLAGLSNLLLGFLPFCGFVAFPLVFLGAAWIPYFASKLHEAGVLFVLAFVFFWPATLALLAKVSLFHSERFFLRNLEEINAELRGLAPTA